VAGLCFLLAVWAMRLPPPGREEAQPLRLMLTALRSRSVLTGMWLLGLPSLALGLVFVLGPLQLDAAGWGALGVTATFLLAAAAEAIVGPGVGIWSDRAGRLAPLRFGLVAAATVLLVLPWLGSAWALATFIILAGLAIGIFWAPAMAMLTDGWEAVGLAHALGFALMNFAWAPGNIIGAAVGGGLAEIAGDATAYAVVASLCVLTFVALRANLRAAPAAG
jgi:predicted MFS family arabinose efflux permease